MELLEIARILFGELCIFYADYILKLLVILHLDLGLIISLPFTGLVIQIFAIGTTISLIGNMSPPKRAS